MAAENAYVKIIIKENGTYLALYPQQGGGTGIQIDEIEDYLSKALGISYNRNAVHNELMKPLSEEKEILMTEEKIPPVDEKVIIKVSLDRLSAKGRFYPPSEGGSLLKKEDIVSEMVKCGIKYGVIQENIDIFLNERKYMKTYLLAEATRQEEGSDAEITYYFNVDITQKPRQNEDGSVDFHHLDMISAVTAGSLLAELKPAVQGKPGIDVCGGLLKPMKVRQKVLRHGKNIKLSEDGLKAYSEVDGHATLEGEQIFVSNMYEVPANVDTSTGDINYDGNVLVHGNVVAGYTIQAKGDIIVEGVVEGATLIAGGQIILKRGIQGMERGVLRAESNIVSRFIENATVEAGGYITADAIMHSNVSAKGDVTVEGKKGFITGGTIRSGTTVAARTIGSTMGTTTVIEVGIDPMMVKEYHELDKEQVENQDTLEKATLTMTALAKRVKFGENLSVEKRLQLASASKTRETLLKRNEEIKERMTTLKENIDGYEGGSISVQGTIYPGCKLVISNAVYYVKQEAVYCRFVKSQGDVKLEGYM